jgi:hypothetical protein
MAGKNLVTFPSSSFVHLLLVVLTFCTPPTPLVNQKRTRLVFVDSLQANGLNSVLSFAMA